MLIRTKKSVIINVLYFLPDHPSLLQEFIWNYNDIVPELRETHKFLNYWHNNIEATINQILLNVDHKGWNDYRNVIDMQNLH